MKNLTVKGKVAEKLKNYLFVLSYVIGVISVGASHTYAEWDLNTADSNIRDKLAIILFLIAAGLAIKDFAKGRKGAAVGEFIVGAFLGIFVASSNPLESMGAFFKSLLGF